MEKHLKTGALKLQEALKLYQLEGELKDTRITHFMKVIRKVGCQNFLEYLLGNTNKTISNFSSELAIGRRELEAWLEEYYEIASICYLLQEAFENSNIDAGLFSKWFTVYKENSYVSDSNLDTFIKACDNDSISNVFFSILYHYHCDGIDDARSAVIQFLQKYWELGKIMQALSYFYQVEYVS